MKLIHQFIINFFFIFLLFGCHSQQKLNTEIISSDLSIQFAIKQANIEITKFLKSKGVTISKASFVYDVIGFVNSEYEENPCGILELISNNSDVNKIMHFSSDFVVAYLIDDKKYLLKSSNHTINHNPKELYTYFLELKMIELAEKKNYLAFIKIMNCRENLILGYKEDSVDIYKYTDDDLSIIYSK